ncbi:hypothetical protein KGP36_07000, partial [Patescibacteria group bacterium]|nr:hypothetical protein [Patescibacteria group bacterium]
RPRISIRIPLCDRREDLSADGVGELLVRAGGGGATTTPARRRSRSSRCSDSSALIRLSRS